MGDSSINSIQYLTFVPLLLYGIGLAYLLSQWKPLFEPKKRYLPYLLLTIILTEVAVYNVFIYIGLINELPGSNYLRYLMYLLPPFLFILIVNAFIPEDGVDTKAHFHEQLPIVFTLLALFVASHFLHSFNEAARVSFLRGLFIIVLLSFAYTRKMWLFYVIVGLWALSFVVRGNTMAI